MEGKMVMWRSWLAGFAEYELQQKSGHGIFIITITISLLIMEF